MTPRLLSIAVLCAAFTLTACAQSSNDAEIEALRAELEQIKKELKEVRDLAPIKQLIADNKPIDLMIDIENAPTKGDPNAPLVLVEFSDYQCPACGRFATQLYPVLAEQLIDTGKARLVFLDFPLTRHEQAFGAAVAARCAGEQDAYWAMHDKLFANQSALFPDDLRGYAAELNLDTEMFNSCFDSSKYDDAIKKDMSLGRLARLRGTPHFVMGYAEEGNRAFLKKPLNDIGLAEFVTVADEMIAEMEAGTR